MLWIEALVAMAALWGAGLSSWIWYQDRQLSKPLVQIGNVEDDLSRIELRITNRASERIVVSNVSPAWQNNSGLKAVSPENDTTRRIIAHRLHGRADFHLPIEPDKTRKLRLYFEPESINMIDVNILWYYDRPASRTVTRLRATWTWEDIDQIRDTMPLQFFTV
ncbi:MAG: hypothetical protein AB1647_14350 [Pseudomonadota bacterium]|jgi:hypothetical protein